MRFVFRRNRFFEVCARFLIMVSCVYYFVPLVAYARESVTIPAGTIVSLRTIDELHPRNLNVGDRVVLKVVSDVRVLGKVVIAAGASARGEITAAKKSGMAGINARIGFSVKSVQAVDGTTISLYGTKFVEGDAKTTESVIFSFLCCLLFLLMKGEDASIPPGTLVDCETAGTVQVEVE